jgi:hypothetical protein
LKSKISGAAIEVLVPGSTLTIENTCFVNNSFSKHGAVNMFNGADVNATNNYATDDSLLECPFIAQAADQDLAFSSGVTCIPSDATACSVTDVSGTATR